MEIEIEGKKVEFDPSAHGLLSQEKVNEISAAQFAKGAKSLDEQLATLRAEKDNALSSLDAHKKTLTDKDKITIEGQEQINTLSESVRKLNESLLSAQAETKKATERDALRSAVSAHSFIGAGLEVFEAVASTRKIDGGYMLADGTTGDAKAYANEFINTPEGKALIKTSQLGGLDTAPSIHGMSFGDVLGDSQRKAQYIGKHGLQKFRESLSEHNKLKKSQRT